MKVLLRQNRRWHENRNLLAVHRRLVRRANRNFSFAETNVAANQPVHWRLAFHIRLDIFDGLKLVGRLFVGKFFLELSLRSVVRVEGETVSGRAARVNFNQLFGNILDGAGGAGLGASPFAGTELGKVRNRFVVGNIFLQNADGIGRQVKLIAAAVLNVKVVALDAVKFERVDAEIFANAVRGVYDVIANLNFTEIFNRVTGVFGGTFQTAPLNLAAENIFLGENRELCRREDETFSERASFEFDGAAEIFFSQQSFNLVELMVGAEQRENFPADFGLALDFFGKKFQLILERSDVGSGQPESVGELSAANFLQHQRDINQTAAARIFNQLLEGKNIRLNGLVLPDEIFNGLADSRGFVEDNNAVLRTGREGLGFFSVGGENRQNGHAVDIFFGAERFCGNFAHGVNHVVEKFKAAGLGRVDWENVDNPAAHAEFAHGVNIVRAFVADFDESGD